MLPFFCCVKGMGDAGEEFENLGGDTGTKDKIKACFLEEEWSTIGE